jgi:hypothetical protein
MGVACSVGKTMGVYTASTDTAPVRTVYNVAVSVQREQMVVELWSSIARRCVCTRAGKVLQALSLHRFFGASVNQNRATLAVSLSHDHTPVHISPRDRSTPVTRLCQPAFLHHRHSHLHFPHRGVDQHTPPVSPLGSASFGCASMRGGMPSLNREHTRVSGDSISMFATLADNVLYI